MDGTLLKGLPGSVTEKNKLQQYLTAFEVIWEMPKELFDWSDFISL